jgi:poly-gamma-glutamate synthesis protein (capsule biosynthesis protein)
MVTIGLAGDTMLGRMVGRELEHRPPDSVWEPALLEVFREADCAIVNLECCISDRGAPWPAPGKPFYFRAPPVAVEALAIAGVKAVWLANNHALDFGETALLDTFRHLESAGIAWAGAGRDLSHARRGTTITVRDVRIGLVGLADHPADFAATPARSGIAWVGPDELARRGPPEWLVAEVQRLAATSDVVAVGPHWGPNMQLRPQPHHPALARALVAAGATVVTGHSAHVTQPIGVIDGAPVCYDLGDLLDDYAVDPELRNDLGILALFTPGKRLELVPLRLEYTRTRLATGDDHARIVERLLTPARRAGIDLRVERGRLVLELPPATTGASVAASPVGSLDPPPRAA